MTQNDTFRLRGISRILELRFPDDNDGIDIFIDTLQDTSLKAKIEAELERMNCGNIKLIIDNYLFDFSEIKIEIENNNNSDSENDFEEDMFDNSDSKYAGTYAHDVEGLSDDFIDDVLGGEPDAYWNID